MVLLLIFLVVFVEGVGFQGADAAEILVGVEGVGLQLDDGHGDVGAVVGHALEVRQQVVENKAVRKLAFAPLKPVDMAQLHLVAQDVYALLQRLDPVGLVYVVVYE